MVKIINPDDGTIRVDQEMAEELDLPTTGLDRDELRARIEDVVENTGLIR